MARIASLAILATPEGNDFLAEKYGAVIKNVQKHTISQRFKNKNLSGDPTAGTVEAKRFQNSATKAYGTARTAGAADKLKVKPVIVAIDTDREILHEVETKDIRLYGVDGLIERTVAQDQRDLNRELERAFFLEGARNATAVTVSGAIEKKLETLIQSLETTKNEFVDGVERDVMHLALTPALYGEARTYFDKVEGGNATAESFNMFHGVRVDSSVYLPEGVDAYLEVEESVAQPVLFNVKNAAQLELSNAYGFGLFVSYGTKAVTPDLIKIIGTVPTTDDGGEG